MTAPQSSGMPDVRKPASTAVRCKVCGYITDAASVKDVCPACGVKAAMFEPLAEKFSDGRRKFLDLHVHPIIVHFPQAFSVTLLVASIMMLLFPEAARVRQVLSDAIEVLAIGLPLTVVASFISGLIDGSVRFKKLSAPFLRLKITVGIVYIILSIVYFGVVFFARPATPATTAIGAGTALGLVVCTTILGNIGAAISYARMPG